MIVHIGGVDEAHPVVKPLLGVISGPDQPLDSPAPNLTDHLDDIGVLTVRNNDHYNDRMDIEGIFNCDGPTYPPGRAVPPKDEVYQVDDKDDGRAAHPWPGDAVTIPSESVQLVNLSRS